MRIDVAEILRSRGLVDEEGYERLRSLSPSNGKTLDRLAVEEGIVGEEELLSAMGEVLDIPFRPSLENEEVPLAFIEKVPLQFAREHNIAAFGMRGDTFLVATSTPFGFRALDDAAAMLEADVEPVFAPSGQIEDLIARGYQMQSSGLGAVLEEIDSNLIEAVGSDIERAEDLLDIANKAPIIKLVSTAISEAIKRRASDIHFHPLVLDGKRITLPSRLFVRTPYWQKIAEMAREMSEPFHLKDVQELIHTCDPSHAHFHVRRAMKAGVIHRLPGPAAGWVAAR